MSVVRSRHCRQPRPARNPDPAQLRAAMARFLPHQGLPLIAGKSNLRWCDRLLVCCAILLSWADATRLKDRFEFALAALKQMFPSRRCPGTSPQGFVQALVRHSQRLLAVVVPALRKRVRQVAGRQHWTSGGWAVFGVDGSRIECPMTQANEEVLGTAGKKNTGPQQFVTVLFHIATGLIWSFRRGPARDSERAHLLQMFEELPKKRTLLLADAGFVGYDLMSRLIDSGRNFLIRIGGNVSVIKGLDCHCRAHGDIVWLWPQKAQKRLQPPLMLRLITVVDQRNRRMHLLTSVLEPQRLSDAEAAALYGKRWGVELIYRSLKQTMGRRRMVSRSPESAAAELSWAIVGLWLLGLMSVSRIIAAGQMPGRWSVATSLRQVRRAAADRGVRRAPLHRRLAEATIDNYQRKSSRKSRHWPHKKREKPPGEPKARWASESEVQLAAALARQTAAA